MIKKIHNLLIWYYMFNKRLFRRYSFILLLLIVPLLIPATRAMMTQDSGVVTIALCVTDKKDAISNEIVDSLVSEDSIIRYIVYETEEEARRSVQKQEADAAWVFGSGMEEKIRKFMTEDMLEPFVKVIEREETIPLRLAREKLFGKVYPHMSYEAYKAYIYNNLLDRDEIDEETLREYYEEIHDSGNVIELRKLDSDEKVEKNTNYLMAPLRGMLSLVVMLCGFAAVMYFLRDQAEGKFDWLPVKKRTAPAFGLCLAAITAAAVVVFIAIYAAGLSVGFGIELAAMIMYIAAATSLCLLLCTIFRSASKLGAIIPFLMIIMLVLCPIFFNMKVLLPMRLMLPPHYYLNAIHNTAYLLYMLIYCVVMNAAVFVITKFFKS